jgi:hypothetical protein
MSLKNESTLFSLLVKIGLGIGVLIVGIVLIANMVTTVDADEIVVKQDLIGGQLHVWDTPGVHWQNFGTITRYKRSAQFWFSAREDEGKKTDDAIKVRFNDGGHGNISGSLRYTLPLDPNKMLEVHKTFHSMKAIDHELIQQVVNKGVYMSGPLMSSRESYAEKRADLINYITDQIVYGVYRTEHEQVKTTDPLTGAEKTVDLVRPKVDPKSPNGVLREEESPIQRFGMSASNITVNSIEYDAVVEAQIKQQQEAINAVQQAIVNSKKAEQDAITVELQGKAAAAKAKWDQEVQKATAVTVAEQEKAVAVTQATKNKEVAALSLETAKLSAQETVTTAKAEADAKRLAMQSDNYQAKKIEATVEINKAWATAYGAQRQVPDISLGGSSGSPMSTAMDAVAVRALRDLNK